MTGSGGACSRHGVYSGLACPGCLADRGATHLPLQLSTDELVDLVESKLAIIAGVMERNGTFQRIGVDVDARSRVVTSDAASNENIAADLRFIRLQIDRSLLLLEVIHQRVNPVPIGSGEPTP